MTALCESLYKNKSKQFRLHDNAPFLDVLIHLALLEPRDMTGAIASLVAN